MMVLFLLLQLPVIVCISLYLNSKKIFSRKGNLYVTSFFEGLGSYLIIVSIFLGGFFASIFIKLLLLILGFIIIAFSKNYINDTEPELDLQIETMKNTIVIFSSTLLLFYVMLSVFRFQDIYLQFLYSILIVIVFNFVSIFLRRWFSIFWDKIDLENSSFVSFRAVHIYIVAFVIVLLVLFINFPKVSVNKSINLANSYSYFSYKDGTNDLVNRYKERLIVDLDMEIDMDHNAYMNQDENHIFIYTEDHLMIYDFIQNKLIYSGYYEDQVNGIEINYINEENNEIKFQSDCTDEEDCNEFTYPYQYGELTYYTYNTITKFDHLDYEQSDTVILNENVLHLFQDSEVDSRLTLISDKPFIGFASSNSYTTDVDHFDGSILYLQVKDNNDQINIKVYQIIEKNIDLILPFYSHYRFGFLVFIFVIGFIPISNYDKHRSVIH
ncbi:hypothetical protein KHQ88_00820 [Mycoplasmatota bacterium]|nr:hypothetical protein KHQ88_00820 [Mycoplasmatota bacterium]